jgi:hypothetical protein
MDVIENPELLLQLCEKIYASQWDYYEAYCSAVGKPSHAFNCQYAFNRTMLRFEDAWKFEGQFINRFCLESGLPLAIHNCGFDPYWAELVERHQAEGVRVILVNGSHPLDLDEWVKFREKFPDIVIAGASLFVNGELEHGTPGSSTAHPRTSSSECARTSRSSPLTDGSRSRPSAACPGGCRSRTSSRCARRSSVTAATPFKPGTEKATRER